jgi:hypothetical protein
MAAHIRCLLFLSIAILEAVPAAAAEPDPRIQRAIDRGVAYLKGLQGPKGEWSYSATPDSPANVGATALAALALLESGVKPDDPVVLKAAGYIRRSGPSLDYTYSLSAAIWFLDRLGDERDEILIQYLAVRLMGGQNEAGAWSYFCPHPNEEDQKWLQKVILEGDKPNNDQKAEKGQKKRPLAPEIEAQLKQLRAGRKPSVQVTPKALHGDPPAVQTADGDNSNTQFAALALWVARRHGLPVELALARVEKRFRSTQQPNGAWVYRPILEEPGTTPAMTCAGLIGLAVGHGVADDRKQKPDRKGVNRNKDPNIKAGIHYLECSVLAINQVKAMDPPGDRAFYFLWSLERVAVIYGLKNIGRTDWYAWGSNVLINSQMTNGSWRGSYSKGGVDTSFALLFLLRANVAKDLTVILRANVRDQDKQRLKAAIAEPGKKK